MRKKTDFEIAEEYREKGDYKKAIEHYMLSAEKGDVDAMNNIGVIYHNGLLGERDLDKAEYWYIKAAKLGSVTAATNYFDVTERRRDGKKAYESIELLLNCPKENIMKEYKTFLYYIGKAIYFGIIGDDEKNLAHLYLNEAFKNDYEDYYYLARMHLNNKSVDYSNVQTGIELMRCCALEGDRDAAIDLANYFFREQDKVKLLEAVDICKQNGVDDVYL